MKHLSTSVQQPVEDVLGITAEQLWPVVLTKGLSLILIWLGAWLLLRLVRLLARRIVAYIDDGDNTKSFEEKQGETLVHILASVGRAVVVGLAILLSFAQFIDIGPLLAGAGILGLAVSFGAQSLVKDVIAGFFILVENQFVVGDVIEANGKSGEVERITLRIVQLRDVEGIQHTIPCGQITTVSNKTAGWSRAVVDVEVGYGEPIDPVLELFQDEANQFADDAAWSPKLDGKPEVFGVQKLGESGVTVRTVFRTEPGNQWAVAREVRRRLKNRLDAAGVEIPFPQRTVWLKQLDTGTPEPRQ